MPQFILLLDILTAIITLVFGVYVLSRAQGRSSFYSFAFTQFGVSAWAASLILVILGIGPIDPPGRLAFSFLIFSIGAFCWFITDFPKPIKGSAYWKVFIGLATSVFFFIPLLPSFVTDITVINWTITGKLSPTLFPAWTLYYTCALVFSIVLLAARAINSTGVERARLVQLAFGFTLFLAGHGSTNILLPFIFADFRWNNLGPVWILVLLPFMATAILRYRLMNIRWIISKSLVIPILTVVVVSFIGIFAFLVSRLVAPELALVVTAVAATLILHPIAHSIERMFNQLFKRGGMSSDQLIEQVFLIARTEIDIIKFTESIQKVIVQGIGAKKSGFVVFSMTNNKIIAQSDIGLASGYEAITVSLTELASRIKFSIIEAEELRWRMEFDPREARYRKKNQQLLDEMGAYGIDVAIPIVMEGRIIAMLLLGSRDMDRVLHNDEVKLLRTIQQGIAPAIANAARFAQMRELYERLKEADLLKSQFVDVVSHQFRTPLSSIRWNVEVLLEEKLRLNKAAMGMLTEVQTNANFLINTLGLLVDVIELESATTDPTHSRQHFDASELMSLVEAFKSEAASRNITVSADIQPLVLRAEKRYIEQALKQLLINAIEYTPEHGTVRVTVKSDNGRAAISVADTGIGMTPVDVKKRAFVKLYRGKNAMQLHPDGIGLGLYLVKLIANKFGGSVSLESVLTKGTTINMFIPIFKSAAHSA